jgi:Ca-activated chloride channel family protein
MVTLLWPWVAAGSAAVVLLVAVVVLLLRRPPAAEGTTVAHSAWVRQLPVVRAVLRREKVTQAVGVVGMVAMLVGAAMASGRPVEENQTTQLMGRRDIVLCLDVSGSMMPYDAEIVRTFTQMVESFDGERIALSVFNATSRTIFPLTDDYDMVLAELDQVQKGLDVDIEGVLYVEELPEVLTPEEYAALMDVWAGTLAYDYASSLVGDGLATCSLLFDETATDRTRSIILATDNEVLGRPVYKLDEAVALADSRQAILYGLVTADWKATDARDRYGENAHYAELAAELVEALEAVGGQVWYAEDPEAVDTVVAEVVADQGKVVAASAPPQTTDRQGLWVAVAGAGVLVLLGARVWGRR